MTLIEKYHRRGEGYDPFLVGPVWQTAFLNYAPEEAPESITKLDVHYRTDEVFVLLSGEAVLIAATINGGNVEFETVLMQTGVVYNIPRLVWHKIAMRPGASVLIVEDSDTHLGDFEFYDLSAEDLIRLREKIDGCFK